MAKANSNNLSSKTREQTIRSCKKCNGNPPLGTCNLQGIQITYCDRTDCMEVINYNNSDIKKITKEEIVKNIKEEVDTRVQFDLKFI